MNKPLKKAVEIAEVSFGRAQRFPLESSMAGASLAAIKDAERIIAEEISDAVRPLRDAAREYLDYMSAEEPETYGPEEKKLDAALKEWEDIE